jgi:hypothetical protein
MGIVDVAHTGAGAGMAGDDVITERTLMMKKGRSFMLVLRCGKGAGHV